MPLCCIVYTINYIITESSEEDSDWEADQRRNLKREQIQREILAGNYDIDNHRSTPPLVFPSSSEPSSSDAEGTADMEDMPTGMCRNAQRKPACSGTKVTAPSTSTSRTRGEEGSDADDEDEGRKPSNLVGFPWRLYARPRHLVGAQLRRLKPLRMNMARPLQQSWQLLALARRRRGLSRCGICTRCGMLVPTVRRVEVFFFCL